MRIFLLLFGIFFAVDGILAVFNRRYLDFMRRRFWAGRDEKKYFPGNTGYIYDRYIRGVGYIVLGIGTFLFAVFGLK
jgi:hypothetical protein